VQKPFTEACAMRAAGCCAARQRVIDGGLKMMLIPPVKTAETADARTLRESQGRI